MFILRIILAVMTFLSAACASSPQKPNMNEVTEATFSYIHKTFMVVEVRINGSFTRKFIFDTGIGLNLISKNLCEQIACKLRGEFTGKRMSGQEVTIPLTTVESLSFGGKVLKNPSVGVFDIESLMPGADIAGFLSLGFFKEFPHTVDYQRKTITFETLPSLERIRAAGARVPVRFDIQGPAFGIFMPLILPNDEQISVEVDTGSQALILHERYMKSLGVASDDPSVKRKDGKDETGHLYSRFFSKLKESIHLPNAPSMKMDRPEVMFQKIIYDGLIGHYFLSQFRVTYDLPGQEMIFRKP